MNVILYYIIHEGKTRDGLWKLRLLLIDDADEASELVKARPHSELIVEKTCSSFS